MYIGEVGLGTFPFSNMFSLVNHAGAERIVRSFIEGGGRYIETAPSYPERGVALGRILRGLPRSSFVLATKCVTSVSPDGSKERSGRPERVREQCYRELERLGVDYLDVLQAHITPEDVPPAETMQALSELKDRGLVKRIGVSNVTKEQLADFLIGGRVDLVQNRFSFLHRAAYLDIVDLCRANDIKLNPYQVIERGQLAEQTAEPHQRRSGDLRSSKSEYSGDAFSVVRKWIEERMRPIARDLDCGLEQLAIAWALRQPQIEICVVGATSTEQVESNLAGMRTRLSDRTLTLMEEAFQELCEHVRNQYGLSLEDFRGLGGS